LRQIAREMGRCIGDGLYDQEPVSTAVAEHAAGARGIIPPRKDAVLSPTATTVPPQRDAHLLAIESEGRCGWKRRAGYNAQSHAENAFSRFKRTLGGTLRAKQDEAQERAAARACQFRKRMRERGRPQSYPVSCKRRSWGQSGACSICATKPLENPGSRGLTVPAAFLG
jgi:hypothetical protein